MSRSAYNLKMPDPQTTSVVFASPHSGRAYPWGFIRNSQLDELTIRSSEDAFVDELYGPAPDAGAPLLMAAVPRAFVDLNRAAHELDPALIAGVQQKGHNPRISSGLGVIPRVVANGCEIQNGKISLAEANRRLDHFYHPYHRMLESLLQQSQAKFGRSLLIDCHSMPHEALTSTSYAYDKRPEIVLGDRFGTSCAPEFMDRIEAVFTSAGLRVSRNLPFAGAFDVQHYGKPEIRRHAVQIEIDRALYLDEQAVERGANYSEFATLMRGVIAQLAEIGRAEIKLAAE